MKYAGTIALAALALAGCTTGYGTPAPGLEGTSWTLTGFTSMDDAIGTVSPADGQVVSITFGPEGRATMQLDCNRGNATYTATPSGATGGQLSFGPVASTRALCPEPRLGEMVAAQLPNVASYTLSDGTLSLALKMDGGIFTFEPER